AGGRPPARPSPAPGQKAGPQSERKLARIANARSKEAGEPGGRMAPVGEHAGMARKGWKSPRLWRGRQSVATLALRGERRGIRQIGRHIGSRSSPALDIA